MSQPPVYPSSGYPHPDPRSHPGYGQYGQSGYQDSGQPSDRGYGQYGQPGYQDGGQPSDRGYGQYGQPGYQDSGQPPNPSYGQPTDRVYSGTAQPSAAAYSGYPQSPTHHAPKKSNTGKIVLVVLAVLVLLVGGGSAAAYFAFKDDVKDVVEASQTRLVAPETLAGRPKITDPELQKLADELVASTKKNVPAATSTIGGFYGDPAKQDMIMIAGASAFVADPAKELDKAIADLGTGGLTVTNAKSVEPGPLGGVAKCGDANAEGTSMGVCAWADRGSLAVIVIYFKTGDQAKAELVKIRGEVEQRS